MKNLLIIMLAMISLQTFAQNHSVTTAKASLSSVPDKQVTSYRPSYYSIGPKYAGEVINVKDTLFLQMENVYASGANQFTYKITNPSTKKSSVAVKPVITNNQGLIRIALPLQNSVVQNGETGILIMNDFKSIITSALKEIRVKTAVRFL